MTRLEKVGFDDYVKENINFKKNKDSNYKIYISKFDSLYSDNQAFEEEFIKEYNDNHITPLTDDELSFINEEDYVKEEFEEDDIGAFLDKNEVCFLSKDKKTKEKVANRICKTLINMLKEDLDEDTKKE